MEISMKNALERHELLKNSPFPRYENLKHILRKIEAKLKEKKTAFSDLWDSYGTPYLVQFFKEINKLRITWEDGWTVVEDLPQEVILKFEDEILQLANALLLVVSYGKGRKWAMTDEGRHYLNQLTHCIDVGLQKGLRPGFFTRISHNRAVNLNLV